MKISATVVARMGSSRLPGKTLRPLLGKPMLARQIERIRQSRLIDEVIIATSTAAENDAIAQMAASEGASCFRGEENDVLGRVVGALRAYQVELHVEFMGDNPLPDAAIIDSVIGFYLKHRDRFDYVTNALTTTYPPGAEVYVYRAEVLYEAEATAEAGMPREHVGIHIYQRPDRFRIHNLEAPPWLRMPDVHLEVDTEEDFAMVRKVFEHLYPINPAFSIRDAAVYARQAGLTGLNSGVARRWKAFRQDA